MVFRTIIALACAPYYGTIVAILTLPIMLVGSLLIGILSIASLVLPLILAVASFFIQAAIYAQGARYAASLTGLKGIVQQPDFFKAVGKSLAITVIVGIISAMVTAAFFIVYFQFGGADDYWWMDEQKLMAAVEIAMKSEAAAEEIFSFENLNLGSLIFLVEMLSMFFISVIAIFVVPRASGVGQDYDRTYTVSLILVRVLIAFPVGAALAIFLGNVFVAFSQHVLDLVATDVAATTLALYFVELTLFTGIIFSFEAGLLKSGREHGAVEVEVAREVEHSETTDFRSIREAWNERT